MAWTWSAPQRGRIAGTAAVTSGHKFINGAVHRAALMLGRGDAARGLLIGFAAFLTLAGALVPHLPPLMMSALLFLSGATLVLYAAFPLPVHDTAPAVADVAASEPPADAARATSHLHELLQPARPTCATDRAAFAKLTAHMSHELRTPLNAILGFSELMSNEVFGPLGASCYASYVRDIHTSGISLLKSADDALAITSLLTATGEHTTSKQTHPALAADDALAFSAHTLATAGLTASSTIDRDTDIIACPQAVRQLLINLIADAAGSAATGAHIALASRTDGSDLEISIVTSGALAVNATSSLESFSMLLARTLAELCGARMQVLDRQVVVRFPRVVQNDFFGYERRAA
ncbi:MAG: HAMP domain-containing histidine kinase [Hyphomicrobium sp.]|nr:HAMP domain-containing histidine kinase [Hyphomicrobium sp.]